MQGWFVIDFSQNTQRLKQSLFWKWLPLFVGNKVKERISKKLWLQENKDRKISQKVTFLVITTGLKPTATQFVNKHSIIQPNWPIWLIVVNG